MGRFEDMVLSKPGARRYYLLKSSGKIQAKNPQEVKCVFMNTWKELQSVVFSDEEKGHIQGKYY